jgi:hypothetical protein
MSVADGPGAFMEFQRRIAPVFDQLKDRYGFVVISSSGRGKLPSDEQLLSEVVGHVEKALKPRPEQFELNPSLLFSVTSATVLIVSFSLTALSLMYMFSSFKL